MLPAKKKNLWYVHLCFTSFTNWCQLKNVWLHLIYIENNGRLYLLMRFANYWPVANCIKEESYDEMIRKITYFFSKIALNLVSVLTTDVWLFFILHYSMLYGIQNEAH